MRQPFNISSAMKYNLQFSLLPHIAAAVGILAFTPALFGITALDATAAAYPLELCLPFLGVILLTPVYSSEQNGILDTVRARKTPHPLICGMRIVIMIAFMIMSISGFVLLMSFLECEVSMAQALASCANAIFLGGLGILVAAISGQTVVGYMVPVLYFVLDLMGGFSSFTLFSMMRAGSMDGKWIFGIVGICCVVASLGCWQIRAGRK